MVDSVCVIDPSLAVAHANVEPLRHFCKHGLGGHGKIPIGKSAVCVATYIGGAIGPQPFRRVVIGVKADAEQVGAMQRGRGCNLLFCRMAKILRDSRAKIRAVGSAYR